MLKSLAKSIISCAEQVDGGVLVFFPSYSVMKNARELWARLDLIDSMKSVKPIHQESQVVSEYQAMIDGFYKDIDNP